MVSGIGKMIFANVEGLKKEVKMRKIIRHGDVNLIEVPKIPKGAKKLKHNGSWILARGEATGSIHKLEVKNKEDLEVYEFNDVRYFVINAPAKITHTHDHEPLVAEPTTYKQVPEREVDHFANSITREVID